MPFDVIVMLNLCCSLFLSSPNEEQYWIHNDYLLINYGTFTWITVQTSVSLTARAGHVALCLAEQSEHEGKEEIAVFGGGDNNGGYFNDLVVFSPSHH